MALEEGSFGPWRWTEGFVRDMLRDPDVRTLVVEDGTPIAYLMLRYTQGHEMAELLSLAVSPQYRRQGIGRRLMGSMERVAAGSGAGTVMLCVRPDNLEAVNLYLSQGYEVLARCQGYYEDGADADMMVKRLEERE
jgi:ribosomal-protein-alanine N-acetyltransferase